MVEELRKFSTKHLTENSTLKKYSSFLQTERSNEVTKKLNLQKRMKLEEQFDSLLELERTCDRTDAANIQIFSIKECHLSHGTGFDNFEISYQEIQAEAEKVILYIQKLSSKETRSLASRPRGDSLKLIEVCRIELPQMNVIKICAINAAQGLIFGNFTSELPGSIVIVQSFTTKKEINKIPFGKKISCCDFDAVRRTFCIYSEREDSKELLVYQFGPDFRTHDQIRQVDLQAKLNISCLQNLCLQYTKKFGWIHEVSPSSRLFKLDYRSEAVTKMQDLPNIVDIKMDPTGQCLFLTNHAGFLHPLMTESLRILPIIQKAISGMEFFIFLQKSILAANLICNESGRYLEIKIIQIEGMQQQIKVEALTRGEKETERTKPETKHWLNNFELMFLKFPCEDILSKEQNVLNFAVIKTVNSDLMLLHAKKRLKHIIESLKKTNTPLRKLTTESKVMNFDYFDLMNPNRMFKRKFFLTQGEFLQTVVTYLPIQIARCQSNEFLVLKQGNPLPVDGVSDFSDMFTSINFGLFESIIYNWTGSVKVVSSMGKQTTGKSYLLNHLVGSSFNISGKRCTDGCWMTIKQVFDCLYIILDFEGIGSFERTDQDDMLLSLFNSALSTITMFKTEPRLDKDTDHFFAKFNMGNSRLRGAENIFQGLFMIIVRDVAAHDIEGVTKEFLEKINRIVENYGENNFISKLYDGRFAVNPFSPFQTDAFFHDIASLRNKVVSTVPIFTSGQAFLETMKLALAKLAISDFTPIDRQQIEIRVKYLKSHLPFAVRYGQLSSDGNRSEEHCLSLLDQKEEKIHSNWEYHPPHIKNTINLNDMDYILTEEKFSALVHMFVDSMEQTPQNFPQWRESLECFVESCIKTRLKRVQIWLNKNMERWDDQENPDYEDAKRSMMDAFTIEKNELERLIKLCDEKCSECFLKCSKFQNHDGQHFCSTSHRCTAFCEFCTGQNNMCINKFGHENAHICDSNKHICGEKCTFANINNCNNSCELTPSHEGEHNCGVKVHRCGKDCSAEFCKGVCFIDAAVKHEIHKCEKSQCSHECSVYGCKNRCAAVDHFHGDSHLRAAYEIEQEIITQKRTPPFITEQGESLFTDEHFCGSEHICAEICEQPGFCQVTVHKEISEQKTFVGRLDKFVYTKNFVQKGEKLPCLRKIAPFQKNHESDHWCSLIDKTHQCQTICPTCENICDLGVNHYGLHSTRHGNMTNCFFLCNEEDFKVGAHKYKVGEPSVAEFCDVCCSSLGRGHIHVIECPGNCDQFSIYSDKRRHQSCKYGPNPDTPKDEMWHSAYWQMIGFEDPCQTADKELFQKCPAYCDSEDHNNTEGGERRDRSYCTLDLWHDEVNYQTVYLNEIERFDHKFECLHGRKKFHFIFLLDTSNSMKGKPWKSAVKATTNFMDSRKSKNNADTFSIILYDNEASVVEEFQKLAEFKSENLVSSFSGSDGTKFSCGLSTADTVIGRNLNKNMTPILIMMSDGRSDCGNAEMSRLAEKYNVAENLQVFTVGFKHQNVRLLTEGMGNPLPLIISSLYLI